MVDHHMIAERPLTFDTRLTASVLQAIESVVGYPMPATAFTVHDWTNR